MLLDAFKSTYLGVISWQDQNHLQNFSVPLLTVAAIILLYLTWRVWAFTIRRKFNPSGPRDIPYWIPGLGHSLSFFIDFDKVIEYGMKITHYSREPFALPIWGERLYILTAANDVAVAYKNNTTLSWDGYLNDLLEGFGLKGEALKLAWHQPKPGDASYLSPNPINPAQKSLVHFTEEIYQRQLLPGQHLDAMSNSYLERLSATLCWDKIAGRYVSAGNGKQKRLSLKGFCRDLMVDAITSSIFGSLLRKIEPDITQDMITFNENAWMLIFRYPEFTSPKLTGSRRRIITALRTYMSLPDEQREGESFAIKNVLQGQKITGIDDESRVAMLLMIYWAANSNTVNLLFWILAYLLFDPSLLTSVKRETEATFQGGSMDTKHLLEGCPLLESVFYEVLRLVNGALSVRKVVAATEIGGKILQPGNKVLFPFRQLHFNKQVWGEDPSRFEPERFMKNKSLASDISYRPFGGGVSKCPGQHMAKIEIMGFIALFLNRFHVGLSTFPELGLRGNPQTFPKLDGSKPSTGITGPVDSMDIFIEVTEAAG